MNFYLDDFGARIVKLIWNAKNTYNEAYKFKPEVPDFFQKLIQNELNGNQKKAFDTFVTQYSPSTHNKLTGFNGLKTIPSPTPQSA